MVNFPPMICRVNTRQRLGLFSVTLTIKFFKINFTCTKYAVNSGWNHLKSYVKTEYRFKYRTCFVRSLQID